ncbi:MAG: FMN-binding negative transcriptional regulator [Pseudomonadota bacterium]
MNDAYPLRPFRVTDTNLLCDIIRHYPLATLMTGRAGSARLTLVPLLVDRPGDATPDIALTGHIDSNNEQTQHLQPGSPVSFQFLGPDSYASPDLYPDPQLPGWLYVSVQGDGEVAECIEADELRDVLVRSTTDFGSSDQRFALLKSDPRVDQFLPYIHGFRIRVARISGIAKLAQDKGHEDSAIAWQYLAAQTNRSSAQLFERLAALGLNLED